MKKIYLKITKHNVVEDIIICQGTTVPSGNFLEIAHTVKLPDLNLFESGKYTYEHGVFTERLDHRGTYWGQDGTVHEILDFGVKPDSQWESDYTKTKTGIYETKKHANDMDWRTNDNLFNLWQKAEKLGWKVVTEHKKAFDAHTKKVTADWRAVQKLKKELGEK